jgi:cytidylate kinase
MAHSVVCISSVTAAGGDAVGQLVAERLGLRYVDDEILDLAARHAGVDRTVVAGAERHRSLVERMIDAVFAPPAEIESYLKLRPREYAASTAAAPTPATENLRQLIKDAIADVAHRGNAVIVAHAASLALTGTPGILRVNVTASPATRIRRLAAANTLLREDEYAKAIQESDRKRLEYLEQFYGVRDEAFTHYDLTVNTDAIALHAAVAAVVAVATT